MVPGGGATEALAVPQVTVEEIGSAAFVLPDFEGQGWDPLWLPVVASETEFFVAEMSGLGDEEFGLWWTLPGGHYSAPRAVWSRVALNHAGGCRPPTLRWRSGARQRS